MPALIEHLGITTADSGMRWPLFPYWMVTKLRTFGRRTFSITVLVALFCFLAAAQIPVLPNATVSQSQPLVPAPKDPRGRETPQSSVLNFMKYAQRGDYESAAKYLQLGTAKQTQQDEETARQLLVLINTAFHGSIGTLSNKPDGSIPDADDPNVEVVGRFVVADQTVPFLLNRITRKDVGSIWLVSSQTVEQVPGLYQRAGSPGLFEYFPTFLIKNTLLGVPLGQWLAWLFSIPLSLIVGWALISLTTWAWRVLKHSPANPMQLHSIGKPLILVLAVLIDVRLVFSIGMPVFYRVYYFRILGVLLTIGGAWLSVRIADQVFERAGKGKLRRESTSLLQLAHRFNNVVIIIIALLLVITILGFDTKTMLAGLGIGGIALALAAQKTLENLIGGITLVMDEAASVGDECVISGRTVTVEEIGLRSIRVVTQEGTEISYPNGMLSQASIENVSRRKTFLISTSISLSYECRLAQLQLVIARVRDLLYSHIRVEPETAKFRFSGLTDTGFRIDLFAYVRTTDGAEFAAIQEDILFRVVNVVESVGAGWAPSEVAHLSSERAVDKKKVAEAEDTIRNWQDSHQFPFPDFSPAHIAKVRGTLAYPPEQSALRRESVSLKNQPEEVA
jgi:MscS family membrane protein